MGVEGVLIINFQTCGKVMLKRALVPLAFC